MTTETRAGRTYRLILASSSPRRRELLTRAGIRFKVIEPSCSEAIPPGLPAELVVQLLARQKAYSVQAPQGSFVIAADTLVLGPQGLMGKPRDGAEAESMLALLGGQRHTVLTGVCVLGPGGAEAMEVSRSTVVMKPVSATEIASYVATGEPLDKAGGYALQGGASDFVEKVIGRVDTVVGLDVSAVFRLLCEVGYPVPLPAATDISRETRRLRRPAMSVSRKRTPNMSKV